MKLIKIISYYLLGIIGIICVSIAPEVIATKGAFNFIGYLSSLFHYFFYIFNPDNWLYIYKDEPVPIFSILWKPYVYSMEVLLGALLLGFFVAFVLAFITNFLPTVIKNFVKRSLSFLESVPDLMIAFMLQVIVVYVAHKTGFVLFDIATLGDERIFLAPILTLSILPMISLYKIILLFTEEELQKSYIEFARSKGMKRPAIFIIHLLRNIAPSVFYHSKIIVWGTLSSLLVIEYIFNMLGITNFILDDFRPIVITASLLLIFTPFFILYQILEYLIVEENSWSVPITNKKRKSWREWLVWGWLKAAWKTLYTHLKNPKFLTGFTLILGAMIYSFVYSIVKDGPVKQITLLYDKNGKILSRPSHPPSDVFLLGSDRYGYDILQEIIVGAKYTLFFALLIALLRMIIGFFFAIPYAFNLNERRQRIVEKVIDSLHYLPLSIVAYLLLRPILWKPDSGFSYAFSERVTLEVLILTFLVVPLVAVLLGNEIKLLMKKEFILSARVLGGNPWHVLTKHILPHLGPRLGMLFGQQFIQVLLIFIHLGAFNLFFGGTDVTYGLLTDPPKTETYEWSGLISASREAILLGKYYMIIPTLVAFMLSIVAMQLVVQGIKEVQQVKVGVPVERSKLFRRRKKKVAQTDKEQANSKAADAFTMTNKTQHYM